MWQKYTLPCSDNRLTPLLTVASGENTLLMMQGVFLGTSAELRSLLSPLIETGSPQNVYVEEIPWVEAAAKIATTQPDSPEPFKSVGPFLYELLPDEAINIIERYINRPPTYSASVFFHGLGGAVAEVPNDATAYFYRKALSNISFFSTWNTPEGADPGIQWVREFRKDMKPFTKGVYVNTPDLSIRNWPKAYYGRNFERLTEVKAKYDPENIFHYPQSIPPSINC